MPSNVQIFKAALHQSFFFLAQVRPAASGSEPLIDKGGQNVVFLGVALLAIAIVTVVGILSPRVEHAIIAAILLSSGLIGLFFTLGH